MPGEGSAATEVVFVGEGPGANEDEQGRPFVGAAGGLLTELIRSIGWKRDEVFITNVVKCRPPGNRDPEPDEIAACSPYLHRQLEALDPALVVTLGRYSLQSFMPGARISAAHGTVRPVDPATGASDASAMPCTTPLRRSARRPSRRRSSRTSPALPDALLRSRERRADRRAAVGGDDDARSAASASVAPATDAMAAAGAAVAVMPEVTTLPVIGFDEEPSVAEPVAIEVAPDPAEATEDPNQMRFF